MGILRGYAVVWNSPSVGLPFVERFCPGAFARSLSSGTDIVALTAHDGFRLLGRTSDGSLRLEEDDKGLAFACNHPETPSGQDVALAVAQGLLTGVSMTFEAKAESWRPGERDITEADLLEISFTDRPHYPATTVHVETSYVERSG